MKRLLVGWTILSDHRSWVCTVCSDSHWIIHWFESWYSTNESNFCSVFQYLQFVSVNHYDISIWDCCSDQYFRSCYIEAQLSDSWSWSEADCKSKFCFSSSRSIDIERIRSRKTCESIFRSYVLHIVISLKNELEIHDVDILTILTIVMDRTNCFAPSRLWSLSYFQIFRLAYYIWIHCIDFLQKYTSTWSLYPSLYDDILELVTVVIVNTCILKTLSHDVCILRRKIFEPCDSDILELEVSDLSGWHRNSSTSCYSWRSDCRNSVEYLIVEHRVKVMRYRESLFVVLELLSPWFFVQVDFRQPDSALWLILDWLSHSVITYHGLEQ